LGWCSFHALNASYKKDDWNEPLDEERFRHYRQGIEQLKRKVEAAGATLVLVTPPFPT
jgi:hypothetical protein